jgi:hypothetical protein
MIAAPIEISVGVFLLFLIFVAVFMMFVTTLVKSLVVPIPAPYLILDVRDKILAGSRMEFKFICTGAAPFQRIQHPPKLNPLRRIPIRALSGQSPHPRPHRHRVRNPRGSPGEAQRCERGRAKATRATGRQALVRFDLPRGIPVSGRLKHSDVPARFLEQYCNALSNTFLGINAGRSQAALPRPSQLPHPRAMK